MSEGEKSPEQNGNHSVKTTFKEKVARLLPFRFGRSKQINNLGSLLVVDQSLRNPLTITSEEVIGDMEPTTSVEQDEIEVETKSSRNTGVGTLFLESLKHKKLSTPEVGIIGVSAIIGTNEAVSAGFFEAVQARSLDGYLVGVGAGNAFTMLHCFQESVTPKGVLLADIDPIAVAVGRMLVSGIKECETAPEFEMKFFGTTEDAFNNSIRQMVESEEDQALKIQWGKIDSDEWQKVWKQLGEREYIKWDEIKGNKAEGQNIDVVGAILDKFGILKQLANEDNIAVAYADFTIPEFVDTVLEMPGFEDSTNVIYFSNIVDHITRRGTDLEQLAQIRKLKAYENQDQKPVYIDTLGQGLNYYLRARRTLADFTDDDFMLRINQPRSRVPEGLVFPDTV